MAPTRSTRILLVAREGPQSPIRRILADAGYHVACANSASAAMEAVQETRPGLIVADSRMLSPADRDKLSLFADTQHIPFLSGKPDRETLLAEVEVSLAVKEPPSEENQQLVVGSLRIDLAARVAVLDQTRLDLTAREFDLLCYLARHPGWVYSREELLEQVWGHRYADPQVVTVHVANLRKKVNAISPGSQLIETVQSIGYRLSATPSALSSKSKRVRMIVGSVAVGVALLLGLGLGLGLGLRGGDEVASASDVEVAAGGTDSATEGTMGIGPELLSQTKTLADVTGVIPEGRFLVTAEEAGEYNEGTYIVVDPADIWPWLQDKLEEKQSDLIAEGTECILWLGEQNRGLDLNAAVTNRLFIPEGLSLEDGYKRNFIGALPRSIPPELERYYLRGNQFAEVGAETTLPGLASGVFMGLIPVANPEEPDTLDHYMEVYVPFLDATFYARISLDEWGPIYGEYWSTRAECLDLRTNFQRARPYEWIVGTYWLRSLLFTYGSDLSGIMQPGDWVMLSFSLDESLDAPFVDSREVQYINHITVQRLRETSFERVRDLIYPDEDMEMGTG